MKRCHRFISNEPYTRFDFEKSLRKYEKIPSKKQKRDAVQSRPAQPSFETKQNTKAKAEEREVQLNSSNEQVQVSPATTEEARQCKECLDPQSVRQFNLQPQASEQNPTSNQGKACETAQDLQQPLLPTTVSPHQLCQQKNDTHLRSSGRFHLNSSVFISTRSLQRLVKLGSEQLVLEQLFKQRRYLAEDRRQVVRRVREYMGEQ